VGADDPPIRSRDRGDLAPDPGVEVGESGVVRGGRGRVRRRPGGVDAAELLGDPGRVPTGVPDVEPEVGSWPSPP
jgi:hypothetical protein